ncbi:hypothetical protein N657DRAFT_448248 [Parathielavia appendiculata]|uniref:Uncharacterized protein n=1 Tax=Parathielavia appendiculata TaxID=2587402 RepID=A0AAN6TYL1_9PEZI|nr:hypothetical protein N657DRAFT_448248 [Parathielavia appendiculata]
MAKVSPTADNGHAKAPTLGPDTGRQRPPATPPYQSSEAITAPATLNACKFNIQTTARSLPTSVGPPSKRFMSLWMATLSAFPATRCSRATCCDPQNENRLRSGNLGES